ncbi:MAG: hypothetical protein JWR88_373 [Pseudonocardia sp.]|nr:hypothetical protein [Pseudonocardia sp.]
MPNSMAASTPLPSAISFRARELVIAGLLVVLALLALYAVFIDQGALLSSAFGESSYGSNYLHEFMHDGRHLLGFPCH